MPTTARRHCEQCLRNTTSKADCAQHPFARQLSMDEPEDREHYLLMRRLRRGHWVPSIIVGGYLVALLSFSGLYCAWVANASVVGSLIIANLSFITLILLAGVVAAPLWVCGVMGRDLVLDVRRKLWGMDCTSPPELLTRYVDDPNPLLSAEEARMIRQAHRNARIKMSYRKLIL